MLLLVLLLALTVYLYWWNRKQLDAPRQRWADFFAARRPSGRD